MIPLEVMEAIVDHSWGKHRSWQNFIERSVILANGTHYVRNRRMATDY